jgi:uncharacterized protein (DUF885 family)
MTRRDCIALIATSVAASAERSDLDRFFAGITAEWLREDPEQATIARPYAGSEQDEMDSRLTDISDAARYRRIALAKEMLGRLRRFERGSMSHPQLISAEVLESRLQDVIGEEPYLSYRFPLNQFTGAQVGLPDFLTDVHPMRNRRDAENYLSRLRAIGPKIDQAAAMMRERAQKSILLPSFIASETVAQMNRFTAPVPARNILVTSFARRLERIASIEREQRNALSASAEKIVRESVYPAYVRAADGLAADHAKATDAAGLWRFPNGAEAYAFFLRRYTTTGRTAKEIHEKGLAEVARIEQEMEELFRRLGYREGPIEARFEKLEKDNLYPDAPGTRERVLADYEKILRRNNERSLEAFEWRPKAPCIVERIPEFQEANAAANYMIPAPDGSRPGIFRVPLPGPRFSRVSMRTLATHEGIPGHHFQLALQVEMTALPSFRRQNPFGPLSAFNEGWGLYAERLAAELGWYKGDEVSDLGRLHGELFRARRLVADTGLHTRRWTRRQAIDYGIPQSEVDRYVVWPGQACSYKIGQMKILELREQARGAMGARFALKNFHNVVLENGSIPLSVLERVVRDWQATGERTA